MKPLKFDDFLYLGRPLNDKEREHVQALQKITPKLFIQFLTDRGAKTSCLSCGRPDLFVPHTVVHRTDHELDDYDGSKDWEYVTPIRKDNGPISIYNFRYEVSCSYCGFTSTYTAHTVVRWARDKGYIVWEGI
ncbi:TPA: hypothetical protein ACGY2B_002679 [Escherichia coli]|nr:hypothetical protein [Escherichia coli]